MSGNIADTLAAHQRDQFGVCACGTFSDHPALSPDEAHAAHQAEVLSSAGYGDLSALLDDLRGLAASRVDRNDLRALLARYAPPDPTPKEQQA